MVPDLIKKYGKEDVWCCFDSDPHANGYFLLNFTNDGKLFLSCWFMSQETGRNNKGPKLVDMPTERKKEKFISWCANNNIDTTNVGFYTIAAD